MLGRINRRNRVQSLTIRRTREPLSARAFYPDKADRKDMVWDRAVEATYAAMIAPVSISNAFAMEVELTSRPVGGVSEGRFELGPYQGAGANAGYRLALITATQAGTPSIELLRLSQKGTTSTLEFYDQPIQLQDEKVHSVSWTRDPNGLMAIQLDGQEVIRTTDRGFRDPFDGVAVVNSGGDFALRRVTVSGTE